MRSGAGKSGVVSLAAVLILAAGCGPGPQDDLAPVIAVEDGVAPTMPADRVAGIVLGRIRADEAVVGRALAPPRILRMTVTTSADVKRFEPGAGNDLPQRPDGRPVVVWIVRAQGTFATQRNHGPAPLSAATGFYVIADVDGSILDFGFP